ncbi:hypothetical protein [Actinophytocola xanthii]|uniref:Uncharacterized protein n=1 Tax=Actinophytocola xanthii TaxID=1912961 RepID=A0A1Q8CVT1_9PSEU|nr:hypothetical protein [Actinophytocola xanthii]OLF18461.1 hypothetical protein BU204_05710 [Actinophytocola xanthii]
MNVLAVSTITDTDGYWSSLKKAHATLPKGTRWLLAVASTDGTRAVNVLVHDSVDGTRDLFERYAGEFASTEYYEADAANAVGLPR